MAKQFVASSLRLDGKTGYVAIPSFDVPTQITIEARVNPASVHTSKIVGKHTDASNVQGTLGLNSGMPNIELTTGGVYRNIQAPNPIPVGTFSHIIAAYDGANVILYVNGISVASTPATGAIATNTFMWAISRLNGSASATNYFNGNIRDVRIYSRALTAGEVAGNNIGNVTRQSLVGEWLLNDGNGTTAKDSLAAHNGIVYGGTSWSPSYAANPFANPIPLFTDAAWVKHSNAQASTDGKTLTLNSAAAWQNSSVTITVLPGVRYELRTELSASTGYAFASVRKPPFSGNDILIEASTPGAGGGSSPNVFFTTPPNVSSVSILVGGSAVGTFTFSNLTLLRVQPSPTGKYLSSVGRFL